MFFLSCFSFGTGFLPLLHNGFELAEGGEFKGKMFNLVQKLNRTPLLKCSTIAPLLANPCCAFVLSNRYVKNLNDVGIVLSLGILFIEYYFLVMSDF
jgi:hypothetical protein